MHNNFEYFHFFFSFFFFVIDLGSSITAVYSINHVTTAQFGLPPTETRSSVCVCVLCFNKIPF